MSRAIPRFTAREAPSPALAAGCTVVRTSRYTEYGVATSWRAPGSGTVERVDEGPHDEAVRLAVGADSPGLVLLAPMRGGPDVVLSFRVKPVGPGTVQAILSVHDP